MKKTLVILTLFILAGCRAKPLYVFKTFPEIGSIATAGVGEALLAQADGTSVGAIVIPHDQLVGDVMVFKGKYVSGGSTKEYARYNGVNLRYPSQPARQGNIYLFKKHAGTNILCISREICANVVYKLDAHTHFVGSRFQQTLIYSGKIGEKITLGYREFSNNLARPAFSNDVSYDLSTSVILGYKGARLEVISATNTEIKYRVLAGFE